MTDTTTKPACSDTTIEVTRKDLPLSCPMPDMALWNAHPKVYLPIDKSGEEACPYCGTTFVLKDDA